MTFENWFLIILGAVGAIGTVLGLLQNHRRDARAVKENKQAEWSLTRPDHDKWRFKRKAPGKVKVYGYTITNITGDYPSITNKFSSPKIFVENAQGGISEELQGELQGERWDLTLYYKDADHIDKVESGQFPKDAEQWIHRLI